MRISDWSADVCSSDLLYVFDHVINDIEIFQANLVPLGQHARLCIGSNVEADERSIGCSRERHVGLSDCAHAAMQHTDLDLVGRSLVERTDDRFPRALNIALHDDRIFDHLVRSDESSVGKESVRTVSIWWSPYH